MKNRLIITKRIILLVSFTLFLSCRFNREEYSIDVKINGEITAKDEYLYLLEGIESEPIDSVLLGNENSISFIRTKEQSPNFYSLAYDDKRKIPITSFFVRQEDVHINIVKKDKQEEGLGLWEVTSIQCKDEELMMWLDFKKGLDPIKLEEEALNKEWEELRSSGMHLDSSLRAPLDLLFTQNSKQRKNYLMKYVKDNQNMTTLYLLNTELRFSFDGEQLSTMLNTYDEGYKNSSFYYALEERIKILEDLKIGATAPDFSIPDVDGNLVSLYSFRGNYVLIDFWASWCGPCRAENPYVFEAYKKFRDKRFKIIGVSYDFPGMKDRWLKAIEDDGLEWVQVSNLMGWNDPTVKLYNISGIPSPFLLDPDGRIIAKNDSLRGDKLLEQLSEIFENK